MNAHPSMTGASIIPTVRYRDVPAAVTWLQEAFGFEAHRLVKDTKGTVIYAELKFGSGMVMVAPIQETPFGKLMVQPDEIGGVETQICYLFVDDAKAHYARAKAAGAEIVLDIEKAANGGRGYSCRDCEGHVWNFGTHNPWTAKTDAAGRPVRRTAWKVLAAGLALAAAIAFFVHKPARDAASDLAFTALGKISTAIESAQAEQRPDRGMDSTALRELRDELSKEQVARATADRFVKDLREQLIQERRTREAAELAAKTAGENRVAASIPPPPANAGGKAAEASTAEARGDLAKARAALKAATDQLAQAQQAKEAAERNAREAREQFAELRRARETAERNAKELRELAVRERSARIAANRTLRKAKESPYTPYPLE